MDMLLKRVKGQVSDTDYDYLQVVDTNVKRLLVLANELIDLSRLETGQVELYRQRIEAADLIQRAVKVVQPEFERRNLRLDVVCPAGVNLWVDPSRMTQVLLNLLTNAYKYTPQGGTLVKVWPDAGRVYIAVSDTGLGIKAADHDRVFQRFFRAGDPRVQKVEGTGLGLNISRQLVELHGGVLTFESEYGVGTVFTMSLPEGEIDESVIDRR
jgi:signal transduction histidine kinase